MKKILLFLTILVFAFASCSHDDYEQEGLGSDNGVLLSVVDSITILPTGEEMYIYLTSASPWSIKQSSDGSSWLKMSTTGGQQGSNAVVLVADVNRTRQKRQCTLTFTSEEVSGKVITVVQDCPYLNVTFEKDGILYDEFSNKLEFKWDDTTKVSGGRLKIESNVAWKIESSDDAVFNFERTEGNSDDEMVITAKKSNVDKKKYLSDITIAAYMPASDDGEKLIGEGVDSYEYRIYQNNLRFLLDDSTEPFDVKINDINTEFEHSSRTEQEHCTILVDSEKEWNIKYCPSWVQATKRECVKSDGLDTLFVRAVSANQTRVENNGEIFLKSDGGAERTLKVYQRPYELGFSKNCISFKNIPDSTEYAVLKTNGPWKIETVSKPQWLDVTPLEGDGTAVLGFTCAGQNLLPAEKNNHDVQIRVTSALNDLDTVIRVTQDEFLFDVKSKDNTSDLSMVDTDYHDLDVTCSGEWSVLVEYVDDNKDWVEYEKVSSTRFRIRAGSVNPDSDNPRRAKYTVISEAQKTGGRPQEEYSRTFEILQNKLQFEIVDDYQKSVPAYSSKLYSVTVNCPIECEMVYCPEYLTFKDNNGSVNGKSTKFNFTVNTNSSLTEQRGPDVIKVKCPYNGKVIETSKITQNNFVFNVESDSFKNLSSGYTSDCMVRINCTDEATWSIVSPGWISNKTKKYAGTQDFVFTVGPNAESEERSGEVIISSQVIDEKCTVKFHQLPYEFEVTGLEQEYKGLDCLSPNPSSIPIHVKCSGDWAIDGLSKAGIEITPAIESGKPTDEDFELKLSPNTDTVSRNVTVKLYSLLHQGKTYAADFEKDFSFSQNPYIFRVSSGNLDFDVIPAKSKSLVVYCSGKWKVISSDENFIKSSNEISSAVQGQQYVYFINPGINESLNPRTCVLKVVSMDNVRLYREINVTQAAYVFEVDKTGELPVSSSDTTFAVNVKSTSNWEISVKSDSANWVKADKLSGEGDGKAETINVTVEANTTQTERTAFLTFESHGNIKMLKIKQAAAKKEEKEEE